MERTRPGIDVRASFCWSCRDLLSAIVIMIMVVIVVMPVILVILVVPVPLMHRPSALIVIVVGMAPVSAGVRRSVPAARYPAVVIVDNGPVTIDPDKAFFRYWGADFIADRRWWSSDINLDLAPCGCC